MAERRKRIDSRRRHRLTDFLRDLPITLDADTAIAVWGVTGDFDEQFRLTICDAACLELAQRRDLPLAALDRDFEVGPRIAYIDWAPQSAGRLASYLSVRRCARPRAFS